MQTRRCSSRKFSFSFRTKFFKTGNLFCRGGASMNIEHQIAHQLKILRLGGFMETLDLRLKQVQEEELGHLTFLQLMIQDEIERREAKNLPRGFPGPLLKKRRPWRGLTSLLTIKSNALWLKTWLPASLSKKKSMFLFMARQESERPIWLRP